MRARIALVVSLAMVVVAIALTLARSPLRVVRVGVRSEESLGTTNGSTVVCQAGETLPGGVSAIRLGLEASFGPKVLARVYSGARVLTTGVRGAGWTSSSVTVPVASTAQTVTPVKLCLYVPSNSGHLQLYGSHAAANTAATGRAGEKLAGRMSVEYMAPGGGSWWSRAQTVARHMGLGRAVSGTWLALLAAALTAAAGALLVGLAWKELP